MLSLEKATWSIRVLPNDVVVLRSTSDAQYSGPPALGIRTALFDPFQWLQVLEIGSGRERLPRACSVESLGDVQCALNWSHPLHRGFDLSWLSKLVR